MSRRAYRWVVWLLTAALGSVSLMWAFLTPGFHAPDEPQHFNSVLRLLRGDGWPEPGEAYLTVGTMTAAAQAGFAPGFESMITVEPVPRDERAVVTDLDEPWPDAASPAHDQMTQHPPGYYTLGAGLLWVLSAQDWRWDDQLLALRLLGVALTVGLVPLTAATALELTRSRSAAATGAALPLAIPQFGHVAGTVTNDVLTTAAGALVVWLAARALARGSSLRLATGLGAALGLGLASKGLLIAGIPMVAVALLVAPAPRRRDRWLRSGLAMAVAFTIGGWWWLRNILVHGTVQPAGQPGLPDATEPVTTGVLTFLRAAASIMSQSFWGNFGWLDVPIPGVWVVVGQTVLVVSLVAAVVWARRAHRVGQLATLWILPLGILAIVLTAVWQSHQRTGQLPALQGRYLFSSLAVIGATVSAAVVLIPPRLRRAMPLAATATAVASAIAALAFALGTMYASDGASWGVAWARWASWSAVPPGWLVAGAALLVASCVAALAAAAAALRPDAPADHTPGPPGSPAPA
ncbi:DUF2142 domain-containing protein [Actinotalea sp. M2MS4P-6]|uniref:DUF2142 domain-containing protein n=1 Tax=Actinotalea sp. M2MS4P-6 TaxID=2983762 RepID=UPI0021E46956|nr:DUF2142 domain-containing protein [Actinotalea sp. M2MS4P-6]MCV2395826.1 DUF2142 domain-containing protein [Actinotalea sp. M2MS4P-6]